MLLTNDKGDEFLLEVKSCTLFSKTGCHVPDANTERGRKHLLFEGIANEGYHTGVLFLVQWDRAGGSCQTTIQIWVAKTFKEVASSLDWKAVAVAWDDTLPCPL